MRVLCFRERIFPHSLAFSLPIMSARQPKSAPAVSPLPIRPAGQALSAYPYHNYVVRSWRPQDREAAASVVREALVPYGLGWDAAGADADAYNVDEHYSGGRSEFWVVCDAEDASKVYGTAAFRPWERSPADTAELRKLYLCASSGVRGKGLGSFLVDACESRASHLGFKYAVIETTSQMTEALRLYKSRGYSPISDIDTARCDVAMKKKLARADEPACSGNDEQVMAVDRDGFLLTSVPREKARRWRMMYGAIVVMILSEDGNRILVQRRSMQKKSFPGALDPFVAGGVSESSLAATCSREMREELGLDTRDFTWAPLWDGVHSYDDGVADRCCFWGFVARATQPEAAFAIEFVDGEVDECIWMTRAEVEAAKMPSPVWAYARALPAPAGMEDAEFFAM